MSGMAEVLADHHSKSYNAELGTVFCLDPTCGWNTQAHNFAIASDEFAAHQAAALSAAGFGPVKGAAVIHIHHDTEAHARSFNEGYEAAVTQGLSDDPSLADDWFQNKLREAAAKALEDAADTAEGTIAAGDIAECAAPVEGESGRYEAVADRDWLYEEPHNWLRNRAAAVRGEG